MDSNRLYYKLNVIFILMLFLPAAGFLYFGFKYDYLLHDQHLKYFAAVALIYIFTGFHLLRKIFDGIIELSITVKDKIRKEIDTGMVDDNQGELQQIIQSFNAIESKLRVSTELLTKRTSEISILKELSDICYVTLDPREIMYVTLERALLLTKADKGSVLILDRTDNKSFIVKASIGLGDFIAIDDRIDFDTSIAKYAVINKSPLVVADIEKERRFGRTNRLHYGSKSFVIMPIKTIKDVIGVLTLSRNEKDSAFSEGDVEALSPLLSNAAFTYENLRLLGEVAFSEKQLLVIKKSFSALNSSLRDCELLHAILNEVQSILPFEVAIVAVRDEKRKDMLKVLDVVASQPVDVSVGHHLQLEGSIIDKVMQQESPKFIDELGTSGEYMQHELLFPGLQGCLLAPLTIRGRVQGIAILYSGKLSDQHKNHHLTEWLAKMLALAIEKSRLVTSVAKRNQELVAIKQIGSALASSTFDLKQVLEYTMAMIQTLMNVQAGSLALVKGNQLEFAVAFAVEMEKLSRVNLVMGQGIMGAVASRGESIIENDVQRSSSFYPQMDKVTGFNTRSALGVPMISQGKVIGVIEVLNKKGGDFTEEDRDVLHSIATSVSIAMENARLYKETVAMAEQERGIRSMFQKFVPKEIVDKIVHGSSAGRTVIDEFKTITLLNIDIRGFSKIARDIGPQKCVALLNYFFSVMGGIVFKHQGIVDKYLGDGFLALFGAPVSTSMDAQNAIAAALEMQQAIRSINEEYVQGLLEEPVRIGISLYTGEVVVGNIGFEMKMDYTVIGDTVNNVFRLQDLTKSSSDSILISESTARAALAPLAMEELEMTIGDMKIFRLQGFRNQ
jgi:class 3 adenylate cyclase/GAF domain-containing protein